MSTSASTSRTTGCRPVRGSGGTNRRATQPAASFPSPIPLSELRQGLLDRQDSESIYRHAHNQGGRFQAIVQWMRASRWPMWVIGSLILVLQLYRLVSRIASKYSEAARPLSKG